MPKTITGTFQYPDGTAVASGVLHLTLSQDAVATGTSQIAPKDITIQLDATGSVPASTTIYANDELTPSGTVYFTDVYTGKQGGRVFGQESWSIAGTSPINLNNIVPSSLNISLANPVLQNPAAPQTITGQSLTLTSTAPLTVNSAATFTGANTHSGTETFTGAVTINTLQGNPIVGGATYPCTAAGMNAAIAALPSVGGFVDAIGCQSSITAQTTTVTVGSSTQQVRLRLPSVTYSGSANPLFIVDRASVLELLPGTLLQQTSSSANGVILAGTGLQWISGGIEGTGKILGPGSGTTGTGVVWGGSSDTGNLTTNAGNRTHIGPIHIAGFGTGLRFGNNVFTVDCKAMIGGSTAGDANGVGVSFPPGLTNVGENIGFSSPASISGNVNQGVNVQVQVEFYGDGISIDNDGNGTANAMVTMNAVNTTFSCKNCHIEQNTGGPDTRNIFDILSSGQLILQGGQFTRNSSLTGAAINATNSSYVGVFGTFFGQTSGTTTNIIKASGTTNVHFFPSSVATGYTTPLTNSGTGILTSSWNNPGAGFIFNSTVAGVEAANAAAGDGAFGRGATQGIVFLGSDGQGFVQRNGSAFSVQASGGTALTFPSGAAATMTQTVASGTATMTTAAITAGACGATVTVVATGVLTTDTITTAFNAAPSGSNAGLTAWPTAGNVNFAYCPGVAETPAAATINWRVVR